MAFALGAALLAALLAGTTFLLTRENLLRQRDATALSQAYINAQILQSQIPKANSSDETLRNDLQSLETPSGSRPVLRSTAPNGTDLWVAANPQFSENQIPQSLQTAVERGQPSEMRYRLDGEPELVIGLPLVSADASYYEIVSLQELKSTLDSLAVSLLGAAAVTIAAGAALGYFIGRRVVRPLAGVSLAAEAIAGGRLDTRLVATNDPDLDLLVTSFNHMASALEGRVERDARFASDVSHELRSPLMTLAASVEVLNARRDELPEGPTQSALDLMVADVERFRQLVEDLLEISRFDAGAARLDLNEVRLAELVMQAVSFSSGQDIPVDLDADLAGVVVRADKRRLVRVLANLLDNAAKYAGGATRVGLTSTDEHVRLTVEDSGPGIAPDDRARVFDRFNRGSGSGRRSSGSEGVGLGLALVQEHVNLHGGKVWVEDRPDGNPGACFVVELPVNPA